MKIERHVGIDTEVKKVEEDDKSSKVEFLHSGCTTLNLALSQKGRKGGWPRGRISNVVGDGSSGKTLLALELAASTFYRMMGNVSKNFPAVKKVKIIFDNVEGVMDFPIEEMYGKQFCEAVEWARSPSIESWGRKVAREIDANKSGELLLYILDSVDALVTEDSKDRFDKAAKTDKPEDGSYGAGAEKAKYLSDSFFNNLCARMEGKDVTLFLISQIRAAIGISYGKKYRRNGGKGLDFYTHAVAWLYEQEKMKRTFRGDDRVYGIRVLARIERNKVAKPFREAEFQALFDYGLDDISSCLAYLYGPKVAKMLWDGEEYSRADLVKHIEENKLQDELADRVDTAWHEIEDAIKPNRERRY